MARTLVPTVSTPNFGVDIMEEDDKLFVQVFRHGDDKVMLVEYADDSLTVDVKSDEADAIEAVFV